MNRQNRFTPVFKNEDVGTNPNPIVLYYHKVGLEPYGRIGIIIIAVIANILLFIPLRQKDIPLIKRYL